MNDHVYLYTSDTALQSPDTRFEIRTLVDFFILKLRTLRLVLSRRHVIITTLLGDGELHLETTCVMTTILKTSNSKIGLFFYLMNPTCHE